MKGNLFSCNDRVLIYSAQVMIGQIFVVPTDTCLGIWCRMDDDVWYKKLYEMKHRDTKKPLALLVPSWDDLAYESTLTPGQINFLKTYKFPFTVVCPIRDDFRDEYPILDTYNYTTVGFRVAEVCVPQEALGYIRYPLFLTSANRAWDSECHTIEEVQEVFWSEKNLLKILPGKAGCQPASNVIQFIWTTNDLKYIRKNYPRT